MRHDLRLILMCDTRILSERRRPVHAVDLLHWHQLVQRALFIDCTALNDHHTLHPLRFYPHDGVALLTVVVGNFTTTVAFASVESVLAGVLLELWQVSVRRAWIIDGV